MKHRMVVSSGHYLELTVYWEQGYWFYIAAESLILLVKHKLSGERVHAQSAQDKALLSVSERGATSLAETLFINLLSAHFKQANGQSQGIPPRPQILSRMPRNAKKVKRVTMPCDV
jgi:hypothetical protein